MSKNINARIRRRQQQRQSWERAVRVFVIAVAVILMILLGYGGVAILQTSFIDPQQPVAQVILSNGTTEIITSSEFQKRVRFERDRYEKQRPDVDTEALIFGATVLDQMILEILARDEAARLGLAVSEDELDSHIEQMYSYRRITPILTQTLAVAPDATLVGILMPPTMTPTPIDGAGYETLYKQDLMDWARLGLTEAEFREIIYAQLLINKLRGAVEKPGFTFDDWIASQQPRVVRLPLWMERFPSNHDNDS